MTLPDEALRAIDNAREFLRSLLNPKQTPRVPRAIRKEAYWVLKHYQSSRDIIELCNGRIDATFADTDGAPCPSRLSALRAQNVVTSKGKRKPLKKKKKK